MEFQHARYSDPIEALKNIDKSFNKLQGRFNSLGTEYANKISGSFENEIFYLFRDNITRRLGAALYHYDLLARLNISGVSTSYALRKAPPDGFYVGLYQSYVFDSIIFHIVSGFDYYASFVKYLTYGHKDNKREIWSKLLKKINSVDNLHQSILKSELIAIDKEFLKKLIDYRALLIHNESDFPKFSQKNKLVEAESIIIVTSPKALHKRFKKHLPPLEDLSLNEISLWLLDSSIDGILRLLDATSIYFEVNRQIPIGKEIIVYETPKKYK